jgi:hexosaminidase
LYDLEADVAEINDVSNAHPDVVARLDGIAEEARATLGDRLTGRRGSAVRPPGRARFARAGTVTHSAVGAAVTLAVDPNPRYAGIGAAVLTDGRVGTQDFADGQWLGFQGRTLNAVVDLGAPRTIRRVGLDCMQNQRPWIFFPRTVEFSVSIDGERWEVVGRQEHPAERSDDISARLIAVSVDAGPARYVRVVARGVDPLPPWHAGAGNPGWIFADEIIVEE